MRHELHDAGFPTKVSDNPAFEKEKKKINRAVMNAYDDRNVLFPAFVALHILPEVVRSDCEYKRIL